MLRPFWYYYGGKFGAAPKYPKPRYSTIIEPFAGAAGYSLRYPDRQVILVEKYHVIAEIWRYLISADPKEILATPDDVRSVDEIEEWAPQPLRWLIGFGFDLASKHTNNTMSAGVRRHVEKRPDCIYRWGVRRDRIASQIGHIRHWRVIEGTYEDAPDVEATWYVDPPYQLAGKHYKHSSKDIDFPAPGAWCQTRRGQVIACENMGADWLPFRPIYETKTAMTGTQNTEAIWCSRLLDYLEVRA